MVQQLLPELIQLVHEFADDRFLLLRTELEDRTDVWRKHIDRGCDWYSHLHVYTHDTLVKNLIRAQAGAKPNERTWIWFYGRRAFKADFFEPTAGRRQLPDPVLHRDFGPLL